MSTKDKYNINEVSSKQNGSHYDQMLLTQCRIILLGKRPPGLRLASLPRRSALLVPRLCEDSGVFGVDLGKSTFFRDRRFLDCLDWPVVADPLLECLFKSTAKSKHQKGAKLVNLRDVKKRRFHSINGWFPTKLILKQSRIPIHGWVSLHSRTHTWSKPMRTNPLKLEIAYLKPLFHFSTSEHPIWVWSARLCWILLASYRLVAYFCWFSSSQFIRSTTMLKFLIGDGISAMLWIKCWAKTISIFSCADYDD